MKLYLKVYRVSGEVMVALCDEDLLGSKFSSRGLTLHVNPEFYGGELVGEEEAIEALKSATIANIVGVKSVELALREGIVHEDSVVYIGGVPHVQMVKVRY